MALRERQAGQIAYGLVFVVLLPTLLFFWAKTLDRMTALPVIQSWPWGCATAGTGLFVMLSGMLELWRTGGGLPMNAFPPPKFVSSGVYALLGHPIYVGFSLICAGAAIALGSPSGLWIVTPVVMLSSAALVLGFELPDLHARFGTFGLRLLPANEVSSTSLRDVVRCYLTVLLPWFVLYEAAVVLGAPPGAKVAYHPVELGVPVLPATESVYASTYLVVLATPLLVRTRRNLRSFSLQALASMVLTFPIYAVVPLISPPRAFAAAGFWAHLMRVERAVDSAAASFPAYHVIWAFLAAQALGTTPTRKWLWRTWAVLVAVSCITTGMHALVDIVAGLLVALFSIHIESVWSWLRSLTETIANSWREWRVGPVRIINHGGYAACAAFVGAVILGYLTDPEKPVIPLAICFGTLLGAALWAQIVEGSPILLRPLGFYGGVLGGIVSATVAAGLMHRSLWSLFAALAVLTPWVQGIGRLRCLVQGCCHGHFAPVAVGVRYTHPRSRVARVPGLRDIPIHATPLYSLLVNVLVGVVVARLYLLRVPPAMICGLYLILSSLGRFVEEAYRGEPQTPIVAGLRLYQWIAVATLFAGAIITTLPSGPLELRAWGQFSSWEKPLWAGLVCALAAWLVTGVDLPESRRRFSRLT